MQFEFPIQPNYAVAGAEGPANGVTMTCYMLSAYDEMPGMKEKPMVVLCPGGGYQFRSNREAEPVATQLMAAGIHVGVLNYSVAPYQYPVAALEVAQAVREVRRHAAEWHVIPDQVYVMGFSAGGHLACTLGTLWDDPLFHKVMGTPVDWRPDAQLLCYPVITMGAFTHAGSRTNLLGDDASTEMVDALSLEKRVTSGTAPAFLWHTQEDASVPVENSLQYVCALRKNAVPFELHVFEEGPHGMSLCNRLTSNVPEKSNPDNACWMDMMVRFIERRMSK